MKVSLIIPALNEEESLPGVLAAIPRNGVDDLIVVDNGSSDSTAAVARRAGAQVITETRKGYGAACRAGVQAAGDADILVFMDGDGSFSPAEIPQLTAPITHGEADLVLGTRTARFEDTCAIPLHARLGNRFIARIIGFASSIRITDLGPFRAIRRAALESLRMEEGTYGWPSEMIIKAAKLQYRISEVPVSYRPRTGGKSKVSGTISGSIRASLSILKVTARWSLWTPDGT
ncbi:MAG: glycosyltransferase family 2 protein [Candidatus Tectomicrobia bacterium]|uniref:Glycosyltransferase family 2 protein n=1 Tax=Tectimicrobiota bacterium TaxID=2528274 RepID=A0A932GPU0_UNCTE|nr:glycosyltransferase family 2 protein [Candidatus Tectomicrobia bacterium]